MTDLDRRQFLRLGAAAGGAFALPGFSVAQADTRPSITIAVQKVVNTNTLETLREQSNVGTRVLSNLLEPLIDTDWLGDLSLQPASRRRGGAWTTGPSSSRCGRG